MTYEDEYQIAHAWERSCGPCLMEPVLDDWTCPGDGDMPDAWCWTARRLRRWTASHIPLDGLPAQVVRAMAANRWRRVASEFGTLAGRVASRSEAP